MAKPCWEHLFLPPVLLCLSLQMPSWPFILTCAPEGWLAWLPQWVFCHLASTRSWSTICFVRLMEMEGPRRSWEGGRTVRWAIYSQLSSDESLKAGHIPLWSLSQFAKSWTRQGLDWGWGEWETYQMKCSGHFALEFERSWATCGLGKVSIRVVQYHPSPKLLLGESLPTVLRGADFC